MPLANPTQTFDRLERAQAAWTRGGASIVVASRTPQGTKRVRFRLDLDGAGDASLRVQSAPQGRFAATDQRYVLRGSALVGVDYDAHEAIRRPAPDRGSMGLRLTAVLGGLDDSIGFLTASEVRTRYLAPFRALGGWQATAHGLVRRTTTAGKASLTRLDLDAAGRLTRLHIELPASTLDWSVAYGPSRSLALPAGYKLVDAFTARLRPPQYANGTAQRVVERMLRAVAGVQNAIVRLDDDATLWIGGPRVRYEEGGAGFGFDGRLLTILTPGAAYQGRTRRGGVIDVVAALLGTVDPFVRSVLVRAVPFAELFPPEARVRAVGTMATGGQPCDVLDVASPRFRASIFVRRADGLPLSVESGALDRRGNQLTTTRRTLRWSSIGTPLPRALFAVRLRPGQSVLPLPRRTPTAP